MSMCLKTYGHSSLKCNPLSLIQLSSLKAEGPYPIKNNRKSTTAINLKLWLLQFLIFHEQLVVCKKHTTFSFKNISKQTNKQKITPFCTYGVRLCNIRRCSKHHQHKQKLQLPNAIWVSQITSQSIWPEFLSFFTSTYAKFLQCAVVRIKKNGTNWTSSSF